MKHSERHSSADDASVSSAGLIVRQREPKNLETPFDRLELCTLRRRSCSIYAVIFRLPGWTAHLISSASMARFGIRLL